MKNIILLTAVLVLAMAGGNGSAFADPITDASAALTAHLEICNSSMIQAVNIDYTEGYSLSEGCWVQRRLKVIDDGARLSFRTVFIVNQPEACNPLLDQTCLYYYVMYDGGTAVSHYKIYPGMPEYPGRPPEANLPLPDTGLSLEKRIRIHLEDPQRTHNGRACGQYFRSPQGMAVSILGYLPPSVESGLYHPEEAEYISYEGRTVLWARFSSGGTARDMVCIFDPEVAGALIERHFLLPEGKALVLKWRDWESSNGLLYPRNVSIYRREGDTIEILRRNYEIHQLEWNPENLSASLFQFQPLPNGSSWVVQDNRVSPPLIDGTPLRVGRQELVRVLDPGTGQLVQMTAEEYFPTSYLKD